MLSRKSPKRKNPFKASMPGSWNSRSSFVGYPSSSLGAGINKATALTRLRRKWSDPLGVNSLKPLSNAFHRRSTPDSGSSDSHAVVFIFSITGECLFQGNPAFPNRPYKAQKVKLEHHLITLKLSFDLCLQSYEGIWRKSAFSLNLV